MQSRYIAQIRELGTIPSMGGYQAQVPQKQIEAPKMILQFL